MISEGFEAPGHYKKLAVILNYVRSQGQELLVAMLIQFIMNKALNWKSLLMGNPKTSFILS